MQGVMSLTPRLVQPSLHPSFLCNMSATRRALVVRYQISVLRRPVLRRPRCSRVRVCVCACVRVCGGIPNNCAEQALAQMRDMITQQRILRVCGSL
jgi:hypothetical protein